eukprot:6204406-Pleurochrysis_carterae.AAC.4
MTIRISPRTSRSRGLRNLPSRRCSTRSMSKLSDVENCAIGAICGTADTTLLQSTNYWKNAQQQRLPFTLNPAVLYRGYGANVLNNGFCVMTQFFLNGLTKKALTGGSDRPLTASEKIGSGFIAGALSGIVCGPIELVMIQQQRKGGSLLGTTINCIKAGPSVFFRGTTGMCAREGIYCGGYLGIMPVVREYVRKTYPDSAGKTEDSARLTAALIAGPVCSFASHPPDTMKTCMQGDIEQTKFKGYAQTTAVLRAETGLPALWRGMPWRLFRQLCAIFLFDKISAELAPVLFPHAFPAR